ncbi:MAG: 2-hydroxyacyl-CoA dehydratase family protein [Bacillota bacterium]
MDRPQILEQLVAVAKTVDNEFISQWKKNGGKVIGYTCLFVPEELIIAAGMLPFRIRGTGNSDTANADIYFSPESTCSFIRNCFESVISGKYDFLDGLVIPRTCDVASIFAENLRSSGSKLPVIQLMLPHVADESAADYYKKQLLKLKTKLEAEYSIEIPAERLSSAISLCNETRRLQQQFCELFKRGEPPLSGADWSAVMTAGQSMPKEKYNSLLRQLLTCYPPAVSGGAASQSKRLMLVGACGDDSLVAETVEKVGGLLAYDFTCFGGISIGGQIVEGSDWAKAFARFRLIDYPYCAILIGAEEKRKAAITLAVKDYAIDGIIGQWLDCCDATAAGMLILQEEMKEAGVPCMLFKREYMPDSFGQITTRIQALCETLTGGDMK